MFNIKFRQFLFYVSSEALNLKSGGGAGRESELLEDLCLTRQTIISKQSHDSVAQFKPYSIRR